MGFLEGFPPVQGKLPGASYPVSVFSRHTDAYILVTINFDPLIGIFVSTLNIKNKLNTHKQAHTHTCTQRQKEQNIATKPCYYSTFTDPSSINHLSLSFAYLMASLHAQQRNMVAVFFEFL